jgi:homoserine O-acetyltransferase/O-succinyltransferase
MKIFGTIVALALVLFSISAGAAEYPAPKQGEWIARDFKFHTGEVMPELKLHYTTVGNSSGIPVVVLHGTGGSAASMLTPAFAGELFGPGQPLDGTKYHVIIPDAVLMIAIFDVFPARGPPDFHALHLRLACNGRLF